MAKHKALKGQAVVADAIAKSKAKAAAKTKGDKKGGSPRRERKGEGKGKRDKKGGDNKDKGPNPNTAKPPEDTARLVTDAQPGAKDRVSTKQKVRDGFTMVQERVLSFEEIAKHFDTGVSRVENTIELSDFVKGYTHLSIPNTLYAPERIMDLEDALQYDLGKVLDNIMGSHPLFKDVTELSHMNKGNFAERENQRPAGYAATTRLHAGRLCIPILNDSGATCSCITEEQVMQLVHHVWTMLDKGLISEDDYNYPLIQFFKFRSAATLKGAAAKSEMVVEYAAILRLEFIPEGQSRGPTKDIYFKIFKKGTCSILGGVLGWPSLDFPTHPGAEGLGWRNSLDGAEYTALGVTVPRLDDRRKAGYNRSVARYNASGGALMALEEDDITGEFFRSIDEASARQLRAASLLADQVPVAQMEPIGLGEFSLDPGERAVLPVRWSRFGQPSVTFCSTHPEAPDGLEVLPGRCDSRDVMSLVVENTSELAVTVTESDYIAVGTEVDAVPTLDSCLELHRVQREFDRSLDWSGGGKDTGRVIKHTQGDGEVFLVIHRVPRFGPCSMEELYTHAGESWRGREPLLRVTTQNFLSGEVDYYEEAADEKGELPDWSQYNWNVPWTGQTVFTFAPGLPEKVAIVEEKVPTCPSEDQVGAGDMLFSVDEQREARSDRCDVCARESILACDCCPSLPKKLCGASCLLRHAEGRYEKHTPDETSTLFEHLCAVKEPKKTAPTPPSGFVLVALHDVLGGARRALELLGLKPALFLCYEEDPDCKTLIQEAWPDVEFLPCLDSPDAELLQPYLNRIPTLSTGLIVGGSACTQFPASTADRGMYLDEGTSGFHTFVEFVEDLRTTTPSIEWHFVLEHVARVNAHDRELVTDLVRRISGKPPLSIDASQFGHTSRNRLYWTSWTTPKAGLVLQDFGKTSNDRSNRVTIVMNPSKRRVPVEQFLDKGAIKHTKGYPFPTAQRWLHRLANSSADELGIDGCDRETLQRWEVAGCPVPPYQFKKENCVIEADGLIRPPNADERERLHGYPPGFTNQLPEHRRLFHIGYSFHCIVLAWVVSGFALQTRYVKESATVEGLWQAAGYSYSTGGSFDPEELESLSLINQLPSGSPSCGRDLAEHRPLNYCFLEDPGVHEQNDLHDLGDRITVVSPPDCDDYDPREEYVMHLVQDDATIAELQQLTVPPDEYYEELMKYWKEWWPKCDPQLLDHMMSLCIAFDTATAFAMSFGISKFALAQEQAKLVGEIVGRYGRSPNPAIVNAIKKWPPVYTLKQLQEFLGTINYVRPHCGPEYCRIAHPLRPLLKPNAVFPPNEEQLKALENLKELVTEFHKLCVPDEADAILAANAWIHGAPPAGRPYELGADTSGYAIGGVVGQCDENNGKLKPLLYITAHLKPHQCNWSPYEQELWGLLHGKREKNKQLGRIPHINHTDHANLARLENLDLNRIEPKHFRWYQEITEGGSLLLHRPGASALHKGPDGLSRNPPGRDQLIRAKDSEWEGYRDRIRGIQRTIEKGEADDEDGEALTLEQVGEN